MRLKHSGTEEDKRLIDDRLTIPAYQKADNGSNMVAFGQETQKQSEDNSNRTKPNLPPLPNTQPNPGPSASSSSTANLPKQEPYTYNPFSYDPYAESEAVRQANALLQQHMNNRPGAYQNQWKAQIDDYLNQIENREDFSYNFNEDALYNQYKDQYIRQGQMAMMDTAGQAAALTGGYGNSYAQNVGQQAYNQHLTQLNNIIPELQQQAYGRYMDEGQRLQDMYNMYMGMENQDYGRYQDDLANWHTQLGYLDDRYNTERQFDYNNWETKLGYDYNNHTTQENMRWEQYLAEQEKNQAAAEMMAAAGNYDRLAQLYGLSADEVKAIQNANAPKYAPTPTGDDVGDAYTSLTWEDWDRAEKKLSGVDSFEKLKEVVDGFYELGYSEETVKALTAAKVRELTELMAPAVEPSRNNRLYGSGRVSG